MDSWADNLYPNRSCCCRGRESAEARTSIGIYGYDATKPAPIDNFGAGCTLSVDVSLGLQIESPVDESKFK